MLDLVLCHKFRNLRLSYRKWSKSESALFRSESVSLRVDKLYAEAIEAVKILAAFSASSTVSIWIRGGIKSGASLWNHSQSVRVSTGAEMSRVLTWSNMWKYIGRWFQCRTSGTVTADRRTFWWATMSSTSPLFCFDFIFPSTSSSLPLRFYLAQHYCWNVWSTKNTVTSSRHDT